MPPVGQQVRAIAVALIAGLCGAADAGELSLLKAPTFEPGRTTKVERKDIGYQGHFLVYLPTDYTPRRKWPVIFFYHGMGGSPGHGVHIAKHFTGGKTYILVGLPYLQEAVSAPTEENNTPALNERRMAIESNALKKIFIPYAREHLSVDDRQFIVAGASRGGWAVSTIIENLPDLWGGAVLLMGGRERDVYGKILRSTRGFRDRPIFIGIGEKDPNLYWSRKAEKVYAGAGANVTLEIFKGIGHSIDMDNEALRKWLVANGPIRFAPADLDAARKLQAAGSLGPAYALFAHVAALSETDKSSVAAAAGMEAIDERAATDLKAVSRAVAIKDYADAVKRLSELAATYRDSPFADDVRRRLDVLKNDPTVRALVEQADLDAAANALEARAAAAEKAKRYADAIRLYEEHARKYPKASRAKAVRAALTKLQADPSVQRALRSGGAEKECAKWLGMADNYISAKLPHRAKPYLQKILDKYPDTTWGDQARERLAGIDDN